MNPSNNPNKHPVRNRIVGTALATLALVGLSRVEANDPAARPAEPSVSEQVLHDTGMHTDESGNPMNIPGEAPQHPAGPDDQEQNQ